jgi:16S rRNA (cytosine967-C5)-methyltransferase
VRPQWLPLLMERVASSNWSDQQLQHFIEQQTRMPPLWLRPQAAQAAEQLVADLVGEGVKAALSSDGHIYASGGKGITTTQVYQQGRVEIQDLASQQIAEAVAVKPGQKVWDSCAGAGGKSLAIAARMANKGVLVATDLYDYKLDELKRRAKRAEMFNIRTFTWNGAEPLRLPKEVAQQQGFDWVLVDAPCSSSGTWRRNPDARWRFDPTDTNELVAIQQQILTQAAPAVRLGGHLVYATCSWQLAENEAQISWFLRQCPQFLLQYQRILGAPQQDADTMFVAVLHRQS